MFHHYPHPAPIHATIASSSSSLSPSSSSSSSSPPPWADAETHTHRTLFAASGRCGSTRWSADDPFGLGNSPICPGQAALSSTEVEGLAVRGKMPRTRTSHLLLPAPVPAAGPGERLFVAFSGLTRRLARQEARNAECGPSSSAAARLWMPDVEKLGRARPGSTLRRPDDLGIGDRGEQLWLWAVACVVDACWCCWCRDIRCTFGCCCCCCSLTPLWI